MNKFSRFQLNNLITSTHDCGVDHVHRSIYLCGDIDHEAAAMFVKNLNLLNELSQEEINVYVNSWGGDVYEGFAIYDCIKNSECHINITVYGQCGSMASVILQAGDERIVSPSSLVMLHEGSVQVDDNMAIANMYVKDMQRAHKVCLSIYFDACHGGPHCKGWTNNKIMKFLQENVAKEWYLNAENAIKYGFADRIL